MYKNVFYSNFKSVVFVVKSHKYDQSIKEFDDMMSRYCMLWLKHSVVNNLKNWSTVRDM